MNKLRLTSITLSTLLPAVCLGEIVTDGSVGIALELPRIQTEQGMFTEVTEQLGQRLGNNLFHSFETFNIASDETVGFSGDAALENVFSRVTGSQASAINGQLLSIIPGADFWLINPNGISLGAGSSLFVDGGIHLSTADNLQFSEGGLFSSNLSVTSQLSMAEPAAFGFVNQPAPITLVNASIGTSFGETIQMVAGDISVSDQSLLNAFGGRIELASLGQSGSWSLLAGAPAYPGMMGRLSLTEGTSIAVNSLTLPGQGIELQAAEISLQDTTLDASAAGAISPVELIATERIEIGGQTLIASIPKGEFPGADIVLSAPDIVLSDQAVISSLVLNPGTGDGGDISIVGENLTILGASAMRADTVAEHQGGSISIVLTGNLVMHGDQFGFPSISTLAIDSEGAPVGQQVGSTGHIEISAKNVTLDAAFLSSANDSAYSNGKNGSIQVAADTILVRDQTAILSDGNSAAGGDIQLVAIDKLILENDKTEIVSDARGDAPAGSILLSADHIIIRDGAVLSSSSIGRGSAGSVTLSGRQIELRSGFITSSAVVEDTLASSGVIKVQASEVLLLDEYESTPGMGSSIVSLNISGGAAGGIALEAPLIQIRGSKVDSSLFAGAGIGGGIEVLADRLEIAETSVISASSFAAGSAGSIDIHAASIVINGNSVVSSDIGDSGDGGLVTIRANQLSLDSGQISTFKNGPGQGGSIDIETGGLEMRNAGFIRADSLLGGSAGQIVIVVDQLDMFDSSVISTLSTSVGGNISIDATDRVALFRLSSIQAFAEGVSATDSGGNITVTRPVFIVLDDAGVFAFANAGNGGNILLSAQQLIIGPNSAINASSQQGIDGDISIDAVDVDLSGALEVLQPEPDVQVAELVDPCAPADSQRRGTLALGTPPVAGFVEDYQSALMSVPVSDASLEPAKIAGITRDCML